MDKTTLKSSIFQKAVVSIIWIFMTLILVAANIGCTNKKELNYEKTAPSLETAYSKTVDNVSDSLLRLFTGYKIMPNDELYIFFYLKKMNNPTDFYIGIGDVISIRFQNVPELNVERQMVLPNGNISMPYIGEVLVVNKTISTLKRELEGLYSKMLQDPELYITLSAISASHTDFNKELNTAPKDISRLIRVRPDGYATLPLIGELYVAKKTIPELNKELNEDYERLNPLLKVDVFLQNLSDSLVR